MCSVSIFTIHIYIYTHTILIYTPYKCISKYTFYITIYRLPVYVCTLNMVHVQSTSVHIWPVCTMHMYIYICLGMYVYRCMSVSVCVAWCSGSGYILSCIGSEVLQSISNIYISKSSTSITDGLCHAHLFTHVHAGHVRWSSAPFWTQATWRRKWWMKPLTMSTSMPPQWCPMLACT